MCNSDLTPLPTTQMSILWSLGLAEASCGFVSLHGNDPEGWKNSGFEERVVKVIKSTMGGGEVTTGKRINAEGMFTLLSPISLTSDCMIPEAPIPMSSFMGGSSLQIPPPQASPSGHMPYDAAELPSAMSVVHLHPPTLIPANSSLALEQLCIFNDACKQHWLLNVKTKVPRAVNEVRV